MTAQLTLLPELEPDDGDSGTVYFLTDLRLIKVGYTGRSRPDCLKQRSGELRGHIIGWLPGTEDDERAYQAPLARWNCGGEWFSVPDDPDALDWLLAVVGALNPLGRVPPTRIFARVLANNLRRAA